MLNLKLNHLRKEQAAPSQLWGEGTVAGAHALLLPWPEFTPSVCPLCYTENATNHLSPPLGTGSVVPIG